MEVLKMQRLLLFAVLFVSLTAFAGELDVVARLDGKNITKQILKEYANSLKNKKYMELLNSREGLKKLAEYYIQRQILLEEAKKTVNKNKEMFKSHSSKVGEDTAYILTYLNMEIGSKVQPTEEEVERYMKEKHVTKVQARRDLMAEKSKKLYLQLIERLKKKHKIEFLY
jgi:hypothetical protein